MNEKISEIKSKAKSGRFWLLSLIDSIVIGGITSATGSAGLAVANLANLDLKVVGTLFLTGAASGVAKYWMQNPLSDIAK